MTELKPGHAYANSCGNVQIHTGVTNGKAYGWYQCHFHWDNPQRLEPAPWPDWAPDWIVEPPREIQVGDWVQWDDRPSLVLAVSPEGDALALANAPSGVRPSSWIATADLIHCDPHPDLEIRQKILKAAGRE